MKDKKHIESLVGQIVRKTDPVLEWNEDVLHCLYQEDAKLSKNVSFEYFKKRMRQAIQEASKNAEVFSLIHFNAIVDEIPAIEVQEFEILYELCGAKLTSDFIQLGAYTLYNYTVNSKQINDKNERFQKRFEETYHKINDINRTKGDVLFLSVNVKAKDVHKAMELADVLIARFENIIAFINGDFKGRHVMDVLNYVRDDKIVRYAFYKTGFTTSLNRSVKFDIDFDDGHLNCTECGNSRIWEMSVTTNINKMERRILNAIEWMGKGLRDKDKPKSLIQFVFAIEGLLQYQVDKMINPSIVSQLADTAAFILAEKKNDRLIIAKGVRDIYAERSKIAHGASSEVSLSIVNQSFELAYKLIRAFLSKEPLSNMKKPEELRNYVESLKFS